MPAFSNLPEDILRLIFNSRSATLRWSSDLIADWKSDLVYLSICKSWRDAMRNLVYAQAIIAVDDESTGDNDSAAFTNIDLIEQNGSQHAVTRLVITVKDLSNSLSLLLSIADVLATRLDEQLPRLAALKARFATESLERYIDEDDTPDFYAVANALSAVTGRHLPRIREVDIESYEYDDVQNEFLDRIIDIYSKQLVRVTCHSIDYFPNLQSATQLQCFKASLFSPGGTNVAPICPSALRYLELCGDEYDFTWNDLRSNEGLDVVRFSHLNKLSIENKHYLYHMDDDVFDFDMEFPQLTSLKLNCVALTPRIAQCLMRAPLRRLGFTGIPAHALMLCSEHADTLKELSVALDCDFHYVPTDSFISSLGELLPLMRNIDKVHCAIYIVDNVIDVSQLDFSHVTHLRLNGIIDFGALIDAIPTMTRMIELTVLFEAFGADQMARATVTLLNLRKQHVAPSCSKIQSLTIQHANNAEASAAFIAALEELRWFLPQLKSLVAHGSPVQDPYHAEPDDSSGWIA